MWYNHVLSKEIVLLLCILDQPRTSTILAKVKHDVLALNKTCSFDSEYSNSEHLRILSRSDEQSIINSFI